MIEFFIFIFFSIISFFTCNSPLFLVSLVFFFSLSLILYLSLVSESYFFCFILFLTFATGLIILFLYICSIVAEEEMIISVFLDQFFFWCFFFFFFESDIFLSDDIFFEYFDYLNLIKSYLFSLSFWTGFYIWFLFMSFIISCNLLKNVSGPLRCFFTKGS